MSATPPDDDEAKTETGGHTFAVLRGMGLNAVALHTCRAAAEQRRLLLLGEWGKVEEWSFDQVRTYSKTDKMLARYVARKRRRH